MHLSIGCVVVLAVGCTNSPNASNLDAGSPVDPSGSPDLTGHGDTAFANGRDPTNPFFSSLGTNGRACATCHDEAAGWSVTPASLRARFAETGGLDPIFRPNDGATSPTADVSTASAREAAYALLLARGVIRVGRAVPAGAELALSAVVDPYGFACATELSLFRRPRPSTNLRFVPALMWDVREPSLAQQAIDATLGHAQATTTASADIASIVAFESSLATAQSDDAAAGALPGPTALAAQPYTPGTAGGFTLYAAWANDPNPRRAAIARGEAIFDTRRFQIRGVGGLADQPGTCTTCHDVPNVGTHATPLALDLGIANPPQPDPALPHYTFVNVADGRTAQTSDPGLALTTGKWDDLSRFEIPNLRGAVMRPPYFHDGSAPSLDAVVQFYERRFGLRLAPQEHQDLVAFLEAL